MAKKPNPEEEMKAMREAAILNPEVQPARRRRTVRKDETETSLEDEDGPLADLKKAQETPEADEEKTAQEEVEETADAAPPKPKKKTVEVDPADATLSLVNVVKAYGKGETRLEVLKGATLHLAKGEIVGLIGPSGAGKSTLLQIAGLLDGPTSGIVRVAGKPAHTLNEQGRTLMRRGTLGFVYQFHHLLKEFSALENVMIPQQLAGAGAGEARKRAKDLLEKVGLGHRLDHRPAKLSGGERQRVAIARALANKPALLLADEPTGNLDPETADTVFNLLLELTRNEGMSALIATHNLELGERMDRMVRLDQGVLHEL